MEIIVLALKIFLIEAAKRLAILAGLMGATMPVDQQSVWWSEIEGGTATYWARLSERENALLQRGQTYGRSCV